LIDLEKKHRRWGVMKRRDELKLYKGHKGYYEKEEECKVISMKDAVLEVSREWDNSCGYYIKMSAGPDTIYEIWTETLREYQLWIDYLKSK